MNKTRCIVIGAGGFAREVRWLIDDLRRAGEPIECLGFVVSDLNALGERDSKELVLGDIDWLTRNRNHFDAISIGIGNPSVRLKIAQELASHFDDSYWRPLVHPSVQMDETTCVVKRGVIVCAGNVVSVNVVFEEFCMVNWNCTIGHEAIIGRGCVINPGCNISGGVVLGEGVLIGTGAQILQYLRIGEGAVVGAGAVVTKDVPPYTTVVGVPAKPLEKSR